MSVMDKLRAMVTCLWRGHDYQWTRNIYGDEINAVNGMRSWWKCRRCQWFTARRELMPEACWWCGCADGQAHRWPDCRGHYAR